MSNTTSEEAELYEGSICSEHEGRLADVLSNVQEPTSCQILASNSSDMIGPIRTNAMTYETVLTRNATTRP